MHDKIISELRTAIHLLQTDGWIRGDLVDANGCMCALGAIGVAAGIEKLELKTSSSYVAFRAYGQAYATTKEVAITLEIEQSLFGERGVYGYGDLYYFNDTVAGSVDDVVALFQRTIDRLQTKDHLEGTKAALIDRGRTTGVLVDEDGCLCLLGGVAVAVFGEVGDRSEWYKKLEDHPEAAAVVSALRDAINPPDLISPNTDVVRFNDLTKDDAVVLAKIDEAIKAVS